MTPNIATIIRDHVSLDVRCIDRLYLHAWMPKLQTSGGLCCFLHDAPGQPDPVAGPLQPAARSVRAAMATFAHRDDPGRALRARAAEGRRRGRRTAALHRPEGVVFIGVAQEQMRSFKAHKRSGPGTKVTVRFLRQSVAVNHYYFYVHDREWGPAFLKVGTYLPYPVKLCLNGHEWVKQRLRASASASTASTTAFCRCADPAALQATCDALGPADVQPSSIAGRIGCPGR